MTDFLFVYGTLRWASDAPMAQTLRERSRFQGPGSIAGRLYRIGHYPGFVPDPSGGPVQGDIIVMADPARMLALLDDYEECAARFPEPHEYCRAIVTVDTPEGPVDAWTYVYAWPTAGLPQIEDGNFLPLEADSGNEAE